MPQAARDGRQHGRGTAGLHRARWAGLQAARHHQRHRGAAGGEQLAQCADDGGRRRLHGRRRREALPLALLRWRTCRVGKHSRPRQPGRGLLEWRRAHDQVHRRDSQTRRLDQVPHRQAAHLLHAVQPGVRALASRLNLRQGVQRAGHRVLGPLGRREDARHHHAQRDAPHAGRVLSERRQPRHGLHAQRVAVTALVLGGRGADRAAGPGRPGTTPPSARTAR